MSRRLVIKATLAGAAMSYAAPEVALAACNEVCLSPAPLTFPYSGDLCLDAQVAVLSNEATSVYEFSGGGTMAINVLGEVTFSAISVVGTPVPGETDLGVINIDSVGSGSGTYISGAIDASVPVTYELGPIGNRVQYLETLQVSGTMTTGSASFEFTVGLFTIAPDTVMTWSSCCC